MPSCVVCQELYKQGRERTCSDKCHQELVRCLIAKYGEEGKLCMDKRASLPMMM